ncbi:hypothetical protein M3J09_000596 [Ascochyta lentis]
MRNYPCCGYHHGGSGVPDTYTKTLTPWKTDDFCSGCTRLELSRFLYGSTIHKNPGKVLTIRKDSPCAMCWFTLAALADERSMDDDVDTVDVTI